MNRGNTDEQPSPQSRRAAPLVFCQASRALPLVSMSVALPWGSSDDPAGKAGSTRLAGALMRRTAGGRDAETMNELVDSLGAALGVETSHSSLVFHGTVIARSFERFLGLLSDAIARPGLDAVELERLKRETVSELRDVLDNDAALARRWFGRKLFNAHPYGRPSAGSVRSVQQITPDDVRAIVAQKFVRENLVFAFAGAIHEDRAMEAARSLTDALPSGRPFVDSTPEPVLHPGRRLVIVDKPERTQTQVLIGGLGTHPRDDDHLALHVATTIFGGTFTARLMQEIRAERGWSYGAYASLPIDRRRHSFSLWTFPNAEDASACIRHQLHMLQRLIADGVTEEELEHAKNYLVRSHAFAVDTASKRAGLALDEVIHELPDGYYSTYTDRVRAVTREQVEAAIRVRLSARDLLVVVVGTEQQIGGSVRAAIDDLESTEVIPFDTDE